MSSTPPPTTQVLHVPTLHEVVWPEEAIFLVDRALPVAYRDHFPASSTIFVEGGEALKTFRSIEILAEQILHLRATRPLTLVAVGGGSIGDAIGFLASILWRGVGLWHVPTTLLAMVDSAHGGKTAVNLKGRKNQLGTFYPAEKVVISRSFLATLPHSLREEGFVELLKALWLGAPECLEHLDHFPTLEGLLSGPVDRHDHLWAELLERAIAVKEEVVAEDPFEITGLRRILNLGHTAGHGLEALYKLPHGRAVAWGLAAMAILSYDEGKLSAQQRDRLLLHLEPLLTPLPDHFSPGELERFHFYLDQDKKRVDGKLISILLDTPGKPLQTNHLSSDHWWDASRQAYQWWRTRPLKVKAPSRSIGRPIDLPLDKSQANRSAMIAALRPGPTVRHLSSGTTSADVADMNRALGILKQQGSDEPVTLFAGEGGTVGRFLLAMAATRQGQTTLIFGEGLRSRPHDPLVEALRKGGASVQKTPQGYQVRGPRHLPDSFQIDVSRSSQFASALALLAAQGSEFTLFTKGPWVSRPYFDLTLAQLREAGVEITENQGEKSFLFRPTERLNAPLEMTIPADTSASVVWRVLAALRGENYQWPPEDPTHPDGAVIAILEALLATSPTGVLEVDLSESPDLAPCLAAFAIQIPQALLVRGAAHLRLKESDRIVDLHAAFEELDLHFAIRDDGFFIPSGVQSPAHDRCFDARGDHRLAMAALVLSASDTPIMIRDAQAVRKSYPDLWRHARQAGFHVQPFLLRVE